MSKPIQYLLVGYPYSGKTTLANELKRQFGFEHINIDQLKWDAGYTHVGDDEVPDKAWDEIFKKADTLIADYLNHGENIANEYAWITKVWRDRARNIAKSLGFDTKVIYLNIPKEEIRKRWLLNSQTKSRFHWPESEFSRVFDEFEEPESDEDVIMYDGKIPLGSWVTETFAK